MDDLHVILKVAKTVLVGQCPIAGRLPIWQAARPPPFIEVVAKLQVTGDNEDERHHLNRKTSTHSAESVGRASVLMSSDDEYECVSDQLLDQTVKLRRHVERQDHTLCDCQYTKYRTWPPLYGATSRHVNHGKLVWTLGIDFDKPGLATTSHTRDALTGFRVLRRVSYPRLTSHV